MSDAINPEAARGWLGLAKEEPVILLMALVGFVVGSIVMYYAVRKGLIPTPGMTAKMKKLHDENMEIKIKMAHIEEELKHTREDSEKWQALLSSFLADKRLDLLNVAATQGGEGNE